MKYKFGYKVLVKDKFFDKKWGYVLDYELLDEGYKYKVRFIEYPNLSDLVLIHEDWYEEKDLHSGE